VILISCVRKQLQLNELLVDNTSQVEVMDEVDEEPEKPDQLINFTMVGGHRSRRPFSPDAREARRPAAS
jgi:hypothetical protein